MSFPILAPFGFFMFIVLIMNIQLGLLSVYTCFSSFIAAAIHFLLNPAVFSQRQLSDRKDFKSCTVPLWDFQVHHHGDSASPQPLKVTWPAAMLYCVCVCVCAFCARAILWYERLYLCSDATRVIHLKKTADNQVLLHYYLGTLIRSRFWDLFSSDLLYSFCNALSHAYQLAT